MSHRFLNLLLAVALTLMCSLNSVGHITHPLTELPLAPLLLMGWGSWNHFGKKVTEADVRAPADAIVFFGLKNLGYTFVNVDGSWEGERDESGVLQPDHRKH